jgi:predicted lipoprotein with Yx(FWY)xxD motif
MRGVAILGAVVMALAATNARSDTQPAPAPLPPTVTIQTVADGTVYANSKGHTLYIFDRDAGPGKSACVDACAEDRAPFAAAWIAKPVGDWSVMTRDDGTRQWVYKNKPLYTFSGDHKPGETNGSGANSSWHMLVELRKFIPAEVSIRNIPYSNLGPALATSEGRTLYLLTQYKYSALGTQRHDKRYGNPGPAGCVGECAKIWLPLKASPDAKPSGDWSLVARDDGAMQWAYKGWPLYIYANDTKPGDATGEAVTTIQSGITGLMWEVATLP